MFFKLEKSTHLFSILSFYIIFPILRILPILLFSFFYPVFSLSIPNSLLLCVSLYLCTSVLNRFNRVRARF